MKRITSLAVGATLGIALFTTALAQGPHGRFPGGPPEGPPEAGAHAMGRISPIYPMTGMYTMIARFDLNVDGKLDSTETAELTTSITSGAVKEPFHPMPTRMEKPKPEMIAKHFSEVYATIVPYDKDKDGVLDATEQAALQTAMDNGELPLPGRPEK